MTTWTTGTLATDGEQIQYHEAGAGDAVVFCHGLGGNHAIWYQQVPVFAQRYRVVTWSQRGFGYSTDRAGASSPATAVRDLDALLDHLSIDRAHLVGQSMGGWAVVGYALHAPGRVRSLVVCDSTGGIHTERMAGMRAARTAAALPADVIGAHPAIGDDLRAGDITKAFLYQQLGGFQTTDAATMIGRLLSTTYPLEAVAAIDVPTLFVVGAQDALIPPAVVREAASVCGAPVVEIDRAGHSPYFERPDGWNEAVLSFLADVSR